MLLKEEILSHFQNSGFFRYFKHSLFRAECLVPCVFEIMDVYCAMLQSIPDVMSKTMLRLELQQKIIQVKSCGYQAVPSNSVPVAPYLHQVPQASANN